MWQGLAAAPPAPEGPIAAGTRPHSASPLNGSASRAHSRSGEARWASGGGTTARQQQQPNFGHNNSTPATIHANVGGHHPLCLSSASSSYATRDLPTPIPPAGAGAEERQNSRLPSPQSRGRSQLFEGAGGKQISMQPDKSFIISTSVPFLRWDPNVDAGAVAPKEPSPSLIAPSLNVGAPCLAEAAASPSPRRPPQNVSASASTPSNQRAGNGETEAQGSDGEKGRQLTAELKSCAPISSRDGLHPLPLPCESANAAAASSSSSSSGALLGGRRAAAVAGGGLGSSFTVSGPKRTGYLTLGSGWGGGGGPGVGMNTSSGGGKGTANAHHAHAVATSQPEAPVGAAKEGGCSLFAFALAPMGRREGAEAGRCPILCSSSAATLHPSSQSGGSSRSLAGCAELPCRTEEEPHPLPLASASCGAHVQRRALAESNWATGSLASEGLAPTGPAALLSSAVPPPLALAPLGTARAPPTAMMMGLPPTAPTPLNSACIHTPNACAFGAPAYPHNTMMSGVSSTTGSPKKNAAAPLQLQLQQRGGGTVAMAGLVSSVGGSSGGSGAGGCGSSGSGSATGATPLSCGGLAAPLFHHCTGGALCTVCAVPSGRHSVATGSSIGWARGPSPLCHPHQPFLHQFRSVTPLSAAAPPLAPQRNQGGAAVFPAQLHSAALAVASHPHQQPHTHHNCVQQQQLIPHHPLKSMHPPQHQTMARTFTDSSSGQVASSSGRGGTARSSLLTAATSSTATTTTSGTAAAAAGCPATAAPRSIIGVPCRSTNMGHTPQMHHHHHTASFYCPLVRFRELSTPVYSTAPNTVTLASATVVSAGGRRRRGNILMGRVIGNMNMGAAADEDDSGGSNNGFGFDEEDDGELSVSAAAGCAAVSTSSALTGDNGGSQKQRHLSRRQKALLNGAPLLLPSNASGAEGSRLGEGATNNNGCLPLFGLQSFAPVRQEEEVGPPVGFAASDCGSAEGGSPFGLAAFGGSRPPKQKQQQRQKSEKGCDRVARTGGALRVTTASDISDGNDSPKDKSNLAAINNAAAAAGSFGIGFGGGLACFSSATPQQSFLLMRGSGDFACGAGRSKRLSSASAPRRSSSNMNAKGNDKAACKLRRAPRPKHDATNVAPAHLPLSDVSGWQTFGFSRDESSSSPLSAAMPAMVLPNYDGTDVTGRAPSAAPPLFPAAPLLRSPTDGGAPLHVVASISPTPVTFIPPACATASCLSLAPATCAAADHATSAASLAASTRSLSLRGGWDLCPPADAAAVVMAINAHDAASPKVGGACNKEGVGGGGEGIGARGSTNPATPAHEYLSKKASNDDGGTSAVVLKATPPRRPETPTTVNHSKSLEEESLEAAKGGPRRCSDAAIGTFTDTATATTAMDTARALLIEKDAASMSIGSSCVSPRATRINGARGRVRATSTCAEAGTAGGVGGSSSALGCCGCALCEALSPPSERPLQLLLASASSREAAAAASTASSDWWLSSEVEGGGAETTATTPSNTKHAVTTCAASSLTSPTAASFPSSAAALHRRRHLLTLRVGAAPQQQHRPFSGHHPRTAAAIGGTTTAPVATTAALSSTTTIGTLSRLTTAAATPTCAAASAGGGRWGFGGGISGECSPPQHIAAFAAGSSPPQFHPLSHQALRCARSPPAAARSERGAVMFAVTTTKVHTAATSTAHGGSASARDELFGLSSCTANPSVASPPPSDAGAHMEKERQLPPGSGGRGVAAGLGSGE